MKKIIILFIGIILPCIAQTRSWYMSPTGIGDITMGDSLTDTRALCLDSIAIVSLNAGDTVFALAGLYNAHANIDFSNHDGTSLLTTTFIGLKAGTTHLHGAIDYNDYAYDTADRPHFLMSGYSFKRGDYYNFAFITMKGANTRLCENGVSNISYKCKYHQDTTGSVGSYALYEPGTYSKVIHCEIVSDNGRGIYIAGTSTIINCYIYGNRNLTSGIGIYGGGTYNILNSIIDGFLYGISSSANNGCVIDGNLIVRCNEGFLGTTNYSTLFSNNIFDSNSVDAAKLTSKVQSNFWVGNHMGRNAVNFNGIDSIGVYGDCLLTKGDPYFKNFGSNWALTDSSACLNSGEGIDTLFAK